MRLARLPQENPRTQGTARRAELRQRSPEHLRQIAALVEDALAARAAAAPKRVVVLGAGACTEIPLERLVRAAGAVTLVDVDVAGMGRARAELPAALRERVEVVRADVTGGVSETLAAELASQPWADLIALGGPRSLAPIEAAAGCLERCRVLDPPEVPYLEPGTFGMGVSSLVLTQLFRLPLLDVLDTLLAVAGEVADLRDTVARYRQAATDFSRRVALAHLSLIATLLAPGGSAAFATDEVGYLLPARSSSHSGEGRESLPMLPPEVLAIPDDLTSRFAVAGHVRRWEWLATPPTAQLPGRLYTVAGAVLRRATAAA